MPVVGLEEFYEVSDLGNVRSKNRIGKTLFGNRKYGGNILKPFTHANGYPTVNLTKKNYRKQFSIHRLVLDAFKGMCPQNMEACHLNGIRSDARLINLRWDTRSNNALDKRNHQTWQGGENNGNAKLTNKQAEVIKTSNLSTKELSKIYNVCQTTIQRVKSNNCYDFAKLNVQK